MKLEEALKTVRFSSESEKAGLNVLYTAWWLKTLISTELKSFALTHEQFNVLRILKGKYPEKMCVRDIGSRMIERSSNVPRIVDRLVTKNLVTRSNSETDKRETVITLTNEGMNVLEDANKKVDSIFSDQQMLQKAEARQLNLLLESMRAKEKLNF